MKKTLLLFAMLLGVVGAWAQETETFVAPEIGKYYIIKGLSTTAPYLGKSNTNSAFSVVASESDAGIFYVEASNNAGKYYMTCVNATSTTQFFGHSGDVRLMDQKQDVTLEAATDGKYYIAVGNNWMHNNKENSIGTGSKDVTPQNQWGFIEAPLNTAPEITLTNVQPNGDRLTLYVDDNNTLNFSFSTPEELGDKAKFAYTINGDKYTFFNKSKNCYMIWRGNTSGGYNNNKGTLSYYYSTYCDWTIATGTKDGIPCFRLQGKRGNNSNGSLILLTPKDQKNYHFDAFDYSDAYSMNRNGSQLSNWFVMNGLKCTLTDKDKNVYTSTYSGIPGNNPTFTGVAGYTLSDEEINGINYTADITFPFPVSSETFANPTLIGQGTWENADKKWTVVDGNVKVVNGDPKLGASLWLIYPTLTGTEFTFKIKSASTDKYVTANPASNADAQANNTPITLTETGTGFKFINTGIENTNGFAYTNNSGTTLFITRNGEGDNNVLLGVYGSSDTHKGNGVRVTQFDGFYITIGSTGYATLYSPIIVAPEVQDLEIYQIESEPKSNFVALTRMYHVYKNQGVILKGTPEETYWFGVSQDWEGFIEEDMWENNKLKGSHFDTYIADDAYVLANGANGVGLYKADLNFYNVDGVWTKETEDAENGTHFKNNAGKAYLPASALSAEAAESRFFVFSFGDDMETGITETENGNVKTENTVVYDLAGRRVQGAQKGIFIVNGKKVVR